MAVFQHYGADECLWVGFAHHRCDQREPVSVRVPGPVAVAEQPYGWNPQYSATWPSGYQWGASYDWTSDYYDNNGVYRSGQVLEMGMGNPLQPGTYYVGVISTTGVNPISYTLVSRGIGTNMTIPIGSLSFSNGVVSNPGLLGREVAYYSIVVPTNLPSWRLELGTNVGESLLMLQKDALPNVGAGGYAPTYLYGGRKMQKAGNEQYLMMPSSGQSNIVAGTYYLAVASEGMNPQQSLSGNEFQFIHANQLWAVGSDKHWGGGQHGCYGHYSDEQQ